MGVPNENDCFDSVKCDVIDRKYGFQRISDNVSRTGYLINMHSIEFLYDDGRLVSALDLFFIKMDGTRFKYTVPYLPYFLVCVEENCFSEITQYFKSKFGSEIANIEKVYKEDLDLPNHLSGLQQPYLKVIFHNQNTLNKVKKIIISATKKYASKTIDDQTLITCSGFPDMVLEGRTKHIEPMDGIIDIREHDLPYHIRVSIDLKIFCGMWYDIKITDNNKAIPIIYPRPDILERPEPIVLAFDIETTKLPLKFPDLQTDQIMMISYVVDGQGYLITNREIISADVYNFEYTPKPEFEGHFIVFNECNEMSVIQKFFSHIIRIRPHIFVTYNGDFFDWPFIEARAAIYGINMNDEIGFSKSREGTFLCRPAIHMDCLCWVKRDSYLPVGSHGLKAVAKAKLRYDPIELDPEEMCKMAVSQPQILSNYSVSDAIATFYLYIKYVHPFIFALNTIIPMEPDEVLRKGSGTLCETLLMVEAYHANIVFPNKQQNAKSKFSNQGNLLDSETYVGGHVEALECGVFRADIPYRFRLDRNMISQLIQSIEIVLEYAIVTEEGVPIEKVTNFQQISREIKQALQGLYDIPNRLEQPVIYHLDVGAMYPNIILTNRLQPSAVVTDADCAACDYNYPDAKCKRTMKWHWRGDVLPASKNELLRIRQQLKTEKFPPIELGGSQRAFHELSQEDQVAYEKKRVLDYCRNVYKKNKLVKLEERNTTICQKENSFYVDTVRAFRDRRYEYKELTKTSKKKVADAVKKGDAAEIKSAKNEEILYDSLQLAHKCILNSFYGYVMRKGARWHSMPMAGIVCLTGSNIITKARHIVERIGRPLELDTDGIWCILPASFPQVFTLHSTHGKKSTFNISYPNAVLNNMVKDHFTNNQYHELIKNCTKSLPEYRVRTENSIFFEVDGPYLAMVLPAAKEEGKKLKKRYAVFNFDGSMAELKGFEVKRRGELQLIKNFQSSVFESFLYGSTLQECYAHVAKIANYWLDVLYSHGQNLPDNELFELISENRSMSKKLEEYGTQKSTSISTAKRLAELLGDQMVKDAGLSCKYVISKKPDGSPVTERAIPLVIFQCEPSIKRHYLRRWLKDSSIGDVNIRDVLDWSYYIERLNGAVQKIITIPAAIQGLSNPVSRVSHPDWLLKRMIEKNDKLKQRQINDMFGTIIQNNKSNFTINNKPTKYKILKKEDTKNSSVCAKRKSSTVECIENYTWKKLLGAPPDIGNTRHEILVWISFQKKKWNIQLDRKQENKQNFKKVRYGNLICTKSFTVSEFLKQSKKALSNKFWQIVHLKAIDEYGTFTIWALVEDGLHKIKLKMPRIFYINQKLKAVNTKILNKKSVNFTLPRSAQAQDIFKCIFQERTFKHNGLRMIGNVSVDDIEGVYETKISLESRFLIEIGCLCKVNTLAAKNTLPTNNTHSNIYSYEQLEKHADTNIYLEKHWTKLKIIFLYQHSFGIKQIWGLFFPSTKRSIVIVLDKVRVNHMSTMQSIYIIERTAYLNKTKTTKDGVENIPENMCFEVFLEVDLGQVYRHIQRSLCQYKENKRGPTLLCTQSLINIDDLKHDIPMFSDFPNIKIHISDDESAFEGINWQNQAARLMIRHFLNLKNILDLMLIQCRYLNIPIGNVPSDPVLVGTDIFYARLLQKNNFVLWWSTTHYPDLGGREVDDFKEFTAVNSNQNVSQNKPGFYSGVCVGLTVQNLAISALLQSSKIREMGGVHSAIALRAQTGAAQSKHEVASCNSVLRILRTMINGWLHEVSLHKNVFSDYHITQFNRWLESKSAFMYDPVITNTLNILMKKLFLGIIKELKRMGVDIIFADLSRIIINSKKNKLLEALDYVEFIVQSIRSRELYHSIKLSYDKSWDNLLWLDASNFAGVNCSVSSDNTQSQEKSFDISFSLCLDINQNQEINNQFEELVVFLIRSFTNKTSIKEAILNNTDKIFSVITDLQNKYHAENPATVSKIVHIIVKIINLSNDLDKDIISLRRNLFKVVDINEFSKTIEFFPRVDLILTGITCKVCNDFRNIDLVNDPQTMRKNVGVWLCPRCLVAFDNLEIERLLGENVTNRITSFSLQDLKCSKCSNIKQENLSKNCGCGGNYMELLNKTEIVGNLSILLKIAKLHQMRTLYHTLIKVLNTY